MKKRCWIFDIDGTLADCTHRKHHIEKEPKDWEAFFAACPDDKIIEHVVEIFEAILWHDNAAIVFVSGRSDDYYELTKTWLEDNLAIEPIILYMRKTGDHRPDHEVKLELLAQLRADGFDPIAAFDDRNSVVRMWREAGIPCFQVAEGDF